MKKRAARKKTRGVKAYAVWCGMVDTFLSEPGRHRENQTFSHETDAEDLCRIHGCAKCKVVRVRITEVR
jgi:hypothetical protein